MTQEQQYQQQQMKSKTILSKPTQQTTSIRYHSQYIFTSTLTFIFIFIFIFIFQLITKEINQKDHIHNTNLIKKREKTLTYFIS